MLLFLHFLVLLGRRAWYLFENWVALNPGARRRERCSICHYLSWTDSIKPSWQFSNFGCYVPKGSPFRLFIKCKISDLIGQTWRIRSNTSQMWTVWPNSTKLSHIQQNTSHVKNPTEFLTPIFADNASCKIFDRLCQMWEIQWYTTRLWKNRPNSYKLWLIGQKTSHVKNATEFLTPLFTESVSPVWHLTKI